MRALVASLGLALSSCLLISPLDTVQSETSGTGGAGTGGTLAQAAGARGQGVAGSGSAGGAKLTGNGGTAGQQILPGWGIGGASGGSGFAGGSPGGSSTAGSSASGGTSGTCLVPASPTISDFADLIPSTDPKNVGGFTFLTGIPGGTSTYSPGAFTVSKVANALNTKGMVQGYTGLVIFLNACTNAAAYTGVSFDIKGNAGPTSTLSFRFQNNANKPSVYGGPCFAPDATTAYDSCHYAETSIKVPPSGGTVSVNFSDVSGGVPVAAVNGSDIVGFEWAFTWAGAVDTPYLVDLTIDNLKFTGGPVRFSGSDGGAGGSSGGPDAGAAGN